MKIIAIIGTSRKKGTISILAENLLKGAYDKGWSTELVNLYDYEIKPCIGCWGCVKSGKCFIKDDFEKLYYKLVEADIVVLGCPVYWANIPGIMKNFFDRHTGYAMYKPPEAPNFYKMSKWKKLKTILKLARKFGPIDQKFRKKRYILITASTIPFKKLMGELSLTIKAMKKYVEKLRGKVIGKLIYTDTLFKFKKAKEEKMYKKAYDMGMKLEQNNYKSFIETKKAKEGVERECMVI